MWERLRIGREQMDLLKMIELSVVIPVYNVEAEIITKRKAFLSSFISLRMLMLFIIPKSYK